MEIWCPPCWWHRHLCLAVGNRGSVALSRAGPPLPWHETGGESGQVLGSLVGGSVVPCSAAAASVTTSLAWLLAQGPG